MDYAGCDSESGVDWMKTETWITAFAIFVSCGVSVLIGYEFGRSHERNLAIKAGVAEWASNRTNQTSTFRYINP